MSRISSIREAAQCPHEGQLRGVSRIPWLRQENRPDKLKFAEDGTTEISGHRCSREPLGDPSARAFEVFLKSQSVYGDPGALGSFEVF